VPVAEQLHQPVPDRTGPIVIFVAQRHEDTA
jgi:hypothetical protein